MITRAELIARGALATGGLYGAGAVAPWVQRALAQEAAGDIAILELALTLETIEAGYYKEALKTKGLDGDVKKAFTEIAAHEESHLKQVKETLDLLDGAKHRYSITATSFAAGNGQDELLRRAIELEEVGLAAYNGAAPALESADLLVALGSIAQVEGRHVGALRELAGEDPAPVAFDRSLSPAAAQQRLKEGL
jgi:rubrerythrin